MRRVQPNPQANMGPVYIALSEPRSDVLACPMPRAKTAVPAASAMPFPKEPINDSVIRRASRGSWLAFNRLAVQAQAYILHGTVSPRPVRIFQKMEI